MQQAIADQQVVTFDYLDRDANPTHREVEPVGVVSLDERWYLVAWCRMRQDARSFRVDRIEHARLTGEVANERDPSLFIEHIPWAVEDPDVLG